MARSDSRSPCCADHPDYVALRLLAWEQMGKPALAGEGAYEWTGSSSFASTGFDPCVVPTLVDLEREEVVVDSKTICNYICSQQTGEGLLPVDPVERSLVQKHLSLVDETPHVALLYDGLAGHDRRPGFVRRIIGGNGGHGMQISSLERRLAEEGATWEGETMKRAYQAKLAKTQAGVLASQKSTNGEKAYNLAAEEKTRAVLAELEQDLSMSSGEWIVGNRFTLADCFQGVSLLRLAWLGNSFLWQDKPEVAAFFESIQKRPKIQEAVLFAEGYLPSPHWIALHGRHRGPVAAATQAARAYGLNAGSVVASMLPRG